MHGGKGGSHLWLAMAIVLAIAGAINWWRVFDEGARGQWVIPAVCFTVGAAIELGLYLQGRARSRNR